MTYCPPPRPARCPHNGSPPRGTCLRDTLAPSQGTSPQLAQRRTRTGRPCPPHPPRPPQRRDTRPLEDAELRALYGIHATTPSSKVVAALREHLQDVNPSKLLAVVPLSQAATTEIFVPQLKALVIPGTQITADLVEAWIWWFNTHQPDQGGISVPHLAEHTGS